MNKLFGGSAFLCVICRKLATKLNKLFQEVEIRMRGIEENLKTAELERDALREKVGRIENMTDQEKVIDVEKEIESGMEKAMIEMTQEMAKEMEMSEREAKTDSICIYGLKESEKEEEDEERKEDGKKVKEMLKEIGVVPKGTVEIRYRAVGKNGKIWVHDGIPLFTLIYCYLT